MKQPQEALPSYGKAQTAATAPPSPKRSCCHCGANLLDSTAKFCWECGKPQSTPDTQITIVSENEEKKQTEEHGISHQDFLVHSNLSRMLVAIKLDKLIRYEERFGRVQEDHEDEYIKAIILLRRTTLVDIDFSVSKWWQKIEAKHTDYVRCSVTDPTHNHYLLDELKQLSQYEWKKYRMKHDWGHDEIDEYCALDCELPLTKKCDKVGTVLTLICLVFLGVSIWVSVDKKEQQTINVWWIMFGIVCFITAIVAGVTGDQEKMFKHRNEFKRGYFDVMEKCIGNVNKMECISDYMFVLFFNESEWEQYLPVKREAKESSRRDIVGRIFVFLFEHKGVKSLDAIPRGTIYKN